MSPTGHSTFEEGLYWQGRLREADEACAKNLASKDLSIDARINLLIVQGMAAFDAGDVSKSIQSLRQATVHAEENKTQVFRARIALFSRLSQYEEPRSTVKLLSEVRQAAHAEGTAFSLGSLHLVVARLEAIRGLSVSARRHLQLSSRLLAAAPVAVQSAILQLDAGLELYAGNLRRARKSAVEGVELAKSHGLLPIYAGCLTNLGSILTAVGKTERAVRLLHQAVSCCTELPVIKFSALDTLMQAALFERELAKASDYEAAAAENRQNHSLPSRSWYDLAHQITRCAYHELVQDWETVLAIVDDAAPEAARREYRGVHTALLCARARACAQIGDHEAAEQILEQALRACPRSAVDPLIVLEASRALCATLRGDRQAGTTHFERARAGAQAIGHRFHERWIERLHDGVAGDQTVAVPRPPVNLTDAALMLTDVATVLGAGHAVDLMAHRVVSLLQSTPLRARTTVESAGNCDYLPNPAAHWEIDANGGALIRIRGSDRRIDIRIAAIRSIEEYSLVKSIGDLVQAAASRAIEAEQDPGDDNLWPVSGITTPDENFVFRSPRMIELLKVAYRLASTDLPVLIIGETGTGKDVLARLMHEQSRVRKGPFVPFNCATVPRDLVESQLFGYKRGAFTGAAESFGGLIRSADGGTLFLDEIGDLDPASQPKLLRFLESGEIQPLGESRPLRVTARLIAATNANLNASVRDGRFRQDLLYRIAGAVLMLPPLRERKDEIPALASYFLARYAAECGRSGVRLADDFVAALLLYDWPGNIRELANEVRRAVALADDGAVLTARDLAPEVARGWESRAATVPVAAAPAGPTITLRLDQTLSQAVEELEEKFIAHALRTTGGRVREAAQLLGLSRKGLFLKRRRRGLVNRSAEAIADGP